MDKSYSVLCNFAPNVHLPETIQIVDGYDSVDSEELSWSQGEIVHLHSLKTLTRAIARDAGGKYYAIPLTHPEKIFEIIPKGCRDQYETVGELRAASPKYVRSLSDIPESTVMKGDILQVIDASKNHGGQTQLKCRIVGKPCTVILSGSLSGPFETMEDGNPSTIRDVLSRRRYVPVRVRVHSGKTRAFDRTNKTPSVKFEGLFDLEQVVQQKTFIVSTLNGGQLRVMKLPIDLEITVKREKSKLEPELFSHICHLIETEVDIDSTITCGSAGHASWYFDLREEIQKLRASDGDNLYEELRPPVPPRSPTSPAGLKQDRISDVNTPRYTPSPSPKPRVLKKPPELEGNTKDIKRVPPQVTQKKKVVDQKRSVKGQPPSSLPRMKGEAVNNGSSAERPTDSREADQHTYELLEELKQKGLKPTLKRQNKPFQDKDSDPKEVNDEAVKESHTVSEQSDVKEAVLSDPQSKDTIQDHQMAGGEFRKRLQGMSVSEIGDCLKTLGLSEYVDLFDQESIDGTMLMEMDDEMMQCIGIKNVFHRKKLLMFIQQGYTPRR